MESSLPIADNSSHPTPHATFEAQWTIDSPTKLFGNLPPRRRAWERQPRQRQATSSATSNTGKKLRTIWKRNKFRIPSVQQSSSAPLVQAQQGQSEEEQIEQQDDTRGQEELPTPDGKIVKRVKLCLNGDLAAGRKKIGAAKWDRRKSALPHKMPKPGRSQDTSEPQAEYKFALVYQGESSDAMGVKALEDDSPDSALSDARGEMQIPDIPQEVERSLVTSDDILACQNDTLATPPLQDTPEDWETREVQQKLHTQPSGLVDDTMFDSNNQHQDRQPDPKPTGPSDIRVAAAQHLEDMRRELGMEKPARLGRRKTDFVPSNNGTPQISKPRRVSAAVDHCRTNITNSTDETDLEKSPKRIKLDSTMHNGESNVSEMLSDNFDRSDSSSFEDDRESNPPLTANVDTLGSEGASTLDAAKYTTESEEIVGATPAVLLTRNTPQEAGDEFSNDESSPIEGEVEALFEEIIEAAVEATSDASIRRPTELIPRNTTRLASGENITFDEKAPVEASPTAINCDPNVEESAFGDTVAQDFAQDTEQNSDTPENEDPGANNGELVRPAQGSQNHVLEALQDEYVSREPEVISASRETSNLHTVEILRTEHLDEGKLGTSTEMLGREDLEVKIKNEHSTDVKANNNQHIFFAPPESPEKLSTVKVSLNDDDTDILKDFLSRAKASKAAKIANQSSLLNRRDSDVVKHALASPRRALEDLDANSPSPRKSTDIEHAREANTVHSESLKRKRDTTSSPTPKPSTLMTGDNVGENDELTETQHSTRRSTRGSDSINGSAKHPHNSASTPSTISGRRQDNSEHVVLKKTEAQELSALTRTNTRRNKGTSVPARAMLKRLRGNPVDEPTNLGGNATCEGRVRWNEELVAYYEEGKADDVGQLSSDNATSLTMSKPRARRAKMLGAMNGTPAKVRSRDVDSPPADENNTMDMQLLAPSGSNIIKESESTAQRQDRLEQDDSQVLAPFSKIEVGTKATRAPRRIPTPAKPVKTERHVPEPMRTRHNSAPGQARRQNSATKDNKENDDAQSSRDKAQKTGAMQTRSGTGIATAADAPKRSMVPRRGGKS